MKKSVLFILALALLMFIAIPATAGPLAAPLPTIESAMPALLSAPAKASMPVENTLFFSEPRPPFFARILASPLVAINTASKFKPIMHITFLAMLAALLGVGLASMNSMKHQRLKYDIRDRMHGLPRDQDELA